MTHPDDPAADLGWAPAAAHAALPSLLAGYERFVLVARGGDSVVYRAYQPGLEREVAVKVVQVSDPETIARFRRELAITVRLGRQHPHIVTVLDTGTTTDGHPCLVMDYFELGSLHDRLIAHGPLPVSEVVAAGTVVADALQFAHAQGVLHRDVKPQNVLVLPTSYVLADFGLARAVDAGHSASLERFSYRHASAQVLDGLPPTTADDVYSLGSTLFTLLDGRAPFAADDPDEDSALAYLRRARTGDPRPLLRNDVPPALRDIITGCLERDPARRPGSSEALRRALESVPTEARGWSPEAAQRAPAPATPALTTPPPATPPPAAAAWLPSAPVQPPVPPEPPEPPEPAPVPPETILPVAEPPVAPSALAHGAAPPGSRSAPAAGTGERDDLTEATGLRPLEEPPESPPDPGPTSRRGRWLSLLAVLFVLAAGAGTAVALLQRPGSPSPRPSSSHTGTGTASTAPPRTVAPTSAVTTGSVPTNPAIAPVITSLQRSGSTLTVTFTDPTHGLASFAYLLADDPSHLTALPVPEGDQTRAGDTVTATIPGVSPQPHWLVVLAVAPAPGGGTEKAPSARVHSN